MFVRPIKVAPAATSAATAGAVEVEVGEADDESELAIFILHLLYAGDPNAGSCPTTSYISLIANVRPERGGRSEEAAAEGGGGGGARMAGTLSSELQQADGALARAASAAALRALSLDDIEAAAETAKVPLLTLRRYPRATAAARRLRERGSVAATIVFRFFFSQLCFLVTFFFSPSPPLPNSPPLPPPPPPTRPSPSPA